MLEFHLNAYSEWLAMEADSNSHDQYPAINMQEMCFLNNPGYFNPKHKEITKITSDVDETFAAAGFRSISFTTAHKDALKEAGVIFCSISDAIREHPELVKKYLGKIVATLDMNYYAALNSVVFRDGSFCYVPKDMQCLLEISSYFLADGMVASNFKRTLIVCDENASVSYLSCTSRTDSCQPSQSRSIHRLRHTTSTGGGAFLRP